MTCMPCNIAPRVTTGPQRERGAVFHFLVLPRPRHPRGGGEEPAGEEDEGKRGLLHRECGLHSHLSCNMEHSLLFLQANLEIPKKSLHAVLSSISR